MKFAKITFWIAGIYGLISLVPLYFMYNTIGRMDPPPLNHPHFYYGFVGVTLVWQFAFFVIATNPVRFRPFILLAACEKLSYILAVAALYSAGSLLPRQTVTALPDTLLAILFVIAFLRTPAARKM
jgi:hypothetical protein